MSQTWADAHLNNLANNNATGVPGVSGAAAVQPAMIENNASQEQGYQQAVDTNYSTTQYGQTTNAAAPTDVNATTYDATKVAPNTPQMTAAQGTVDPRSVVTAEQEQVDKQNSTVQGQLQQLMDGDQRYAQGAVRRANETMAARGLGSSSLAGEAITNAVIESALPIAQADASIYAQFQQANLNARQQASLANAEKYATVNLANLNNKQQANLVNTQSKLQTLLSDQSADNAAKQFNAANQTQTDQFMANLASNIEQFNATQSNAMAQFNAGQSNTMQSLAAQLNAQREQFNTTMRSQIDQSNVAWRRQLNTINTATQNQANMTNAQNSLNLSNWALNAIWQEQRDLADYAFTSSENDKNRATNFAILASQQAFQAGQADNAANQQMYQAVGGFAANLINNLLK